MATFQSAGAGDETGNVAREFIEVGDTRPGADATTPVEAPAGQKTRADALAQLRVQSALIDYGLRLLSTRTCVARITPSPRW